MMWRTLIIIGATLTALNSALAQQQPPIGADLLQRLQATPPSDLAEQARGALNALNQMPPDQRKAAEAAAQAQIPALMGAATEWWGKLTPEQQAAYQQQLQGMSLLSKTK